MILVLLGTNDKKFTRLLDAVEKQIKSGNIKEKVIVQAGCTDYTSNNMEIFDLIPKNKLDDLVKEADLIITHGGVGSILQGLENNKKVIAVARLSKYNEHTNDHQVQIVEEFAKQGYVIELKDFNKLDEIIKEAKSFKPNKYKSNNENFVKTISNYIDKENNTSRYNKYRCLLSFGMPGIIMSIINIIIFSFFDINLILNVLVSYLITLVLSLLTNVLMDIKLSIKYIIVKIFNLILDLSIMYLFVNIISINDIISKIITNILIIIIVFIIYKIINRGKKL